MTATVSTLLSRQQASVTVAVECANVGKISFSTAVVYRAIDEVRKA